MGYGSPMNDQPIPSPIEDEETAEIENQTMEEMVWGDPDDPMDHGQTEAQWRHDNGPGYLP
jgi:hypothetical protein